MDILIDLDGVVANLVDKWLTIYNRKYNDNLQSKDIIFWDASLCAKKCSSEQFYDIINAPGFFSDLDVIPNAIEITKKLQKKGHGLWFVTAPPYDNPTGAYDKFNWINMHFPHIGRDKVIQTHSKHVVKGDVLFDDGPKNIENFPGITVTMDYPYNRNIKTTFRVHNWLEFEKIIDHISKHFNEKTK